MITVDQAIELLQDQSDQGRGDWPVEVAGELAEYVLVATGENGETIAIEHATESVLQDAPMTEPVAS